MSAEENVGSDPNDRRATKRCEWVVVLISGHQRQFPHGRQDRFGFGADQPVGADVGKGDDAIPVDDHHGRLRQLPGSGSGGVADE